MKLHVIHLYEPQNFVFAIMAFDWCKIQIFLPKKLRKMSAHQIVIYFFSRLLTYKQNTVVKK